MAPIEGRVFSEADDRAPGASTVVVVSERLWRRRFAADPALVGGTIRINGVPLTVIGILPSAFSGLSGAAELWLPRMMAPVLTYGDYLTTPGQPPSLDRQMVEDLGFTLERPC
jgi:hypothetical protein